MPRDYKAPRGTPNPPPALNLKRGRPTVYEEGFVENSRRLYLLGLTMEEVAKFFDVSGTTLLLWERKYRDFRMARAESQVMADADVAKSLRERALGYSHKAEKILVVNGVVQREEYVQHYPPDTNAAALWLSNRQGGRWKLRSTNEEQKDAAITINIKGGLPDD